jgi:hypothetical protein
MCKRLFAFVIALALCSAASAQQGKLSLDIQLIKLSIRGSQTGPEDFFSVQRNGGMSVGGLPESSLDSGRFSLRFKFTPRFAFDFGTADKGWTAVAWGFRQSVRAGSETSSILGSYNRLEAASIDVAYRTKLSGGITMYAGIKTAYMRTEQDETLAVNDENQNIVTAGGIGPLVGISYVVKISRLELAASISQSFLGMRSQGSFQSEYVSQDFGRTNLASITESSARVSYRVTSRMSLGLGAFFSSWHGVTITNGSMQDPKPLRQDITFGGGLASLDFLF